MISFKGKHDPKDAILFAVFVTFAMPFPITISRNSLAERGVDVDHATFYRWVIEYGSLVADEA